MDWSTILSVSPNELNVEELESIPKHLCSVDPNALSNEELKQFFELNRFLINHLSNETQGKMKMNKGKFICIFWCFVTDKMFTICRFVGISQADSLLEKKLVKGSDTDESYYIQTIQEVRN